MTINTDNKEEVIHITFHQLDHSKALEQEIYQKAEKLFKTHPFIMDCRIVVNSPHHHKHKGNLYQIRVDIKVPGEELIVNKQKEKEHSHENPYIAVSNAFKTAEHLLQQYKEKTHDIVKHHTLRI